MPRHSALRRWLEQEAEQNDVSFSAQVRHLAQRSRVSVRTIYNALSGLPLSWSVTHRLSRVTGLTYEDFAPTRRREAA